MSRTARCLLAVAAVVASFAPAASALDECVEVEVGGPVIAVCRSF